MLRTLHFFVLLVFLLAACASNTQPEPTPLPTATPQAAPPVQQAPPLELTMWHTWTGRGAQVLDLLARRYEQGHPNTRINLQARPAASLVRDYSASVANGSAPQLLLVLSRYVGELADRRHILPLDGQIADATLSDVLAPALDGARAVGRLHGMPLSYDSLVLFYDRRQIAEAPVTIDQLLAYVPPAAEPAAEQALPTSRGLAFHLSAASALPYLPTFDGAVFEPDGAVGLDSTRREGTVRWLEWLQSLRANSRAYATEDFGAVDAMIQSNRIAASIDWTYRMPAYEQLWGKEAVGITALPRIDGQSPVPSTFLLSDVLCINTVTSAQQRAAATDFLAYLSGLEAQELLWTRGGQQPVNQAARVEGSAVDVASAGSTGVAFPNSVADGRAWPVLDEMVRSALAGSVTAVEAMETAASRLREIDQRQ